MSLNTSSGKSFLPSFFQVGEGNQLYACHHIPDPASERVAAALICNPAGHEYESCHRAMRQLAVQLARSGSHAMRFDYSGTGDSTGEYAQASLAQWRHDVECAIDKCQQVTGHKQVCMIGMRLGATLAAQAASVREDIESLVLYAPVLNGDAVLVEWKDEQAKYDRKLNLPPSQGALNEVIGYPLTDEFKAELKSGCNITAPNLTLRRVLILAEDIEDTEVKQAAEILGSCGASVTVEALDDFAIWRREPIEAIVPFKLLRRIVTWLNEGLK